MAIKNPFSPLTIPVEWNGVMRNFGVQLAGIITDIYLKLTKQKEEVKELTTTKSYVDQTITSGVVTLSYPDGMSSTSHSYLIIPQYKSSNLTGWSASTELGEDITIHVTQGTTTPADDSKVSFTLMCIKL